MLAQYGWTEADIRAHSLDWVDDTWAAIDAHAGQKFRVELAGTIRAVYAATAGVHGGEEAFEQMKETIDSLLRDPNTDGEVDYLLDSNAKPDEVALMAWAAGGGWGGATTPLGAPDRPSGISYRRMTREEYEHAIRSN